MTGKPKTIKISRIERRMMTPGAILRLAALYLDFSVSPTIYQCFLLASMGFRKALYLMFEMVRSKAFPEKIKSS